MQRVRDHTFSRDVYFNCADCNGVDNIVVDEAGRLAKMGNEECPYCDHLLVDILSLMKSRGYRLSWHLGKEKIHYYGPRGFKVKC